MIDQKAILVDEKGSGYRLSPLVHLVSSSELILSTGVSFRCVYPTPAGLIPEDTARELMMDGWVEQISAGHIQNGNLLLRRATLILTGYMPTEPLLDDLIVFAHYRGVHLDIKAVQA